MDILLNLEYLYTVILYKENNRLIYKIENLTFPKILSLNNPFFNYNF